MSNPSLPPAPVPPMALFSSCPLRRRARDPDDDDEDDLEEGELRDVPVPVHGGQQHESSDSDDDTEDDDDGRCYLFQPRVEHDDPEPEVVVRRPHHRRSPRRHRPTALDALDILLLGPGAGGALPSPTPSDECESDATLSDDDHHHARGGGGGGNHTGSSSSAGFSSPVGRNPIGRGWAATGKRGLKAGGNKNKKPATAVVVALLAHAPTTPLVSDLNTVSLFPGDGQAGTTGSNAHAAAHHHPPPLPEQAAQPPRAPQQHPPPPRRERATEYTCKECGKSYPTNQALGGHAAGHKNKQREAEAMAAAMAAAAGGDGAGAAAFLPLRRGGGKAEGPHECRKCGKLFPTGVALGGHMRVHYNGRPIVPARKNKKRCLAPPPPPTAEGDIVAVAAAPPVGLSLALSIKTEEESPSTPPAAAPAGGDVRVVRLFGIDISPEVQAPLQQQQQQPQGSGGTTEDSSSTAQQQH